MNFLLPLTWNSSRLPLILVASCAFIFSSCDSQKRAAKTLLEEKGIETSGESLLTALTDKDHAVADALLTMDVLPSVKDSAQRTPLMLAAANGGGMLLPRIVKLGGSVSQSDPQGHTALSYAVENGQLESVVRLLDLGAQPDDAPHEGGSLIANALQQDRLAIFHLLLNAGANPASKGADGESLAQIAIEKGQGSVLTELVKRGIDLKSDPGRGSGLLHLALELERGKMFSQLVKKGLDPNSRNKDGDTVVHVAMANKLHKFLPVLTAQGASLDAIDSQGWRPLHNAIRSGDEKLVKTLIKLGTKVNENSKRGEKSQPPLDLAIEKQRHNIVSTLLDSGANPGDELYQAIQRNDSEGAKLVKILLQAGVPPSPTRAPERDTPLGLAIRTGQIEAAKLLIDAGASQNEVDLTGQKPLHVAVAVGNVPIVDYLLEDGADPEETFQQPISKEFLGIIQTDGIARWALPKGRGMRPIMLASDSGNLELAQTILKHGANRQKSTKVGRHRFWPITFATRRSDYKMMQVILGRKPGKTPIWARIDLSEQRAYFYKHDKLIFKTRISSGKKGNRTRKGKFVVTNKYRHWTSTLYNSPMPYFQRLSGSDFGFHVGHCPGYAASHGCVRMPHSSARKVFGLTKVGDYVEIVP